MWGEIISMAMNNGLWAVLFCLLFLYELKDSRKREHKYQDTVAKLTSSMEIVRDIKDECNEIKNDVRALKTTKSAAVSKKPSNKIKTSIDTAASLAINAEAI